MAMGGDDKHRLRRGASGPATSCKDITGVDHFRPSIVHP